MLLRLAAYTVGVMPLPALAEAEAFLTLALDMCLHPMVRTGGLVQPPAGAVVAPDGTFEVERGSHSMQGAMPDVCMITGFATSVELELPTSTNALDLQDHDAVARSVQSFVHDALAEGVVRERAPCSETPEWPFPGSIRTTTLESPHHSVILVIQIARSEPITIGSDHGVEVSGVAVMGMPRAACDATTSGSG